ncbi:hypothetical protein QBC38DRAFT_480094 [Podospora fimiseda]|uniref:NADH:flavin oxidoreductase/NADH oxidase N-terminal domain-containing protein n=1 Tax=Podospora fimiseda TaxID=252190 RepID=A0AAN7H300_9PEZI|nr:hypothetical protein QBC38DRAFT_480094 [Podospora fimiseda]
MSQSNLFKPLTLSPSLPPLSHRIALAPLTRYRADDAHVPIVPLVSKYYTQRASSIPGTLLVTEATFISPSAGGYANVPGIYTPAQISAWKEIVSSVHSQGGIIFLQLWSLGRAAHQDEAEKEGFQVHSASDIPIPESEGGGAVPKPMTIDEIKIRIQEYATAAKNAVLEAGFDGVEIHGANGYLVDQFLQSNSNQRTDSYGGSVENRSRFALEVIAAVTEAVGPERTAIRLSPWTTFQGMRMPDPIPQFSHLVSTIQEKYPNMAYLHFVQARVKGNKTAEEEDDESLDFALKIWKGPVLIAGNLDASSAKELVDEHYKERDNLVAVFGRYFISNPDLPFRVREGIPFSPYDRDTFYTPKSAVGYIDQAFSKEFEKVNGVRAQI